jgi:hypothetical protein
LETPLTKFVPVTVSVKLESVAAAAVELSVPIVGALTVKVLAEVTAVAVFWTVTLPAPEVASWVAVTVAVSDVALL